MTHLQPIYLPDRGKDDCDMINLEGEFDFRADRPGEEVYDSLKERAEMIGGIVTTEGKNEVRVYPWNGPGSFVLHFPAKDESVEQIDVLDRDGEVVEEYPIEQMIERGKAAKVATDYLNEHMEEADEDTPEENETYRIDFSEGELVPADDGENAEE